MSALRKAKRKLLRSCGEWSDRFWLWGVRKGIRPVPVLVYQMGKVGSTSIHHTLREAGIRCLHLHRISPENIEAVHHSKKEKGRKTADESLGLDLARRIGNESGKIKIITLVREPVSRNISAYFQNLGDYFADGNVKGIQVDEAIQSFLDEYPHQVPLQWFDQELQSVTGVDVFSEPFDSEKGHGIIEQGRFSVLVIKVEISNGEKEKAIAEFLQLPAIKLVSANVGSRKDYANLYRSFRDHVKLPAEYVDELLNSRYAKHFYSEEERSSIREQWLSHSP